MKLLRSHFIENTYKLGGVYQGMGIIVIRDNVSGNVSGNVSVTLSVTLSVTHTVTLSVTHTATLSL